MEVVRGKMNLQMLEKIEAWRKIKQTTKKVSFLNDLH